MKVAAFVPIKLNNQRLPGKNLMLLNGRPLCEYIFSTIAKVKNVDASFVYCSDEQIKSHIPNNIQFLKRDEYLNGNNVKGTEIIEHFIRDIDADIYLLTHATQPFTKASSLEIALGEVIGGKYDSAFSAVKFQDYCWYNGKPFNYDMDNLVPTQQLEPVYMETGAFFIFKKEVFVNTRRRIGKNPYIHIVDSFEAVDIDTADDFEMAEAVAEYLAKKENQK